MTRVKKNPDGTRTFYIDEDALQAASMLEDEDAPELSEEQFDRLTDEMRKAREEDLQEGSA